MPYMDKRQQNVSVFEDTRTWYTQDAMLKDAVRKSRHGTKFYAPGAVSPAPELLARFPRICTSLFRRNGRFRRPGNMPARRLPY